MGVWLRLTSEREMGVRLVLMGEREIVWNVRFCSCCLQEVLPKGGVNLEHRNKILLAVATAASLFLPPQFVNGRHRCSLNARSTADAAAASQHSPATTFCCNCGVLQVNLLYVKNLFRGRIRSLEMATLMNYLQYQYPQGFSAVYNCLSSPELDKAN
ncbi:hypothetical protein WN943_000690 [Citrus x changshan-huyou]